VQVATKSTSAASPETSNTKPVRVGANSRVTPPTNFFTGEADEVRIWKDDLTPTEVSNAFAGTSFNTGDQVLYLDFVNVQSGLSGGYTYGPSLSLSGP
jgi:Concanavalin A-like lectin/glucanases superfamily